MFIEMEKWHGAKNDFLVTWILTTDRDMLVPTFERLAPKLCARDGSGVAADGILVLVASSSKSPHPNELVIINSDGSQAKNCGNGLRCAAMSARKRALREGISEFDGVTLTVQGLAIDCRFLGKEGTPFVAVTMPAPTINAANSWNDEVSEDYDDELDNLEDYYNEDSKEKEEDQTADIISNSENESVYDINGDKIVIN